MRKTMQTALVAGLLTATAAAPAQAAAPNQKFGVQYLNYSGAYCGVRITTSPNVGFAYMWWDETDQAHVNHLNATDQQPGGQQMRVEIDPVRAGGNITYPTKQDGYWEYNYGYGITQWRLHANGGTSGWVTTPKAYCGR
ncbi:hypothetical protein JIG36_44570 [Actinoplanes sp. LDG1-06]|uniref:Uncharacterized protein n=1 Tax=Paractinoplanes ovalisporus TaxID=2810368 RepID=A0ABS2AT81_9ACTN|nr:hypothetical protein [Actinoplanes ovalisporus]MBM2622598.1 hypothetical protein [Actinoplanes ovalisporus]